MRTKGSWPGAVTLRSGWAKAVARPWSDGSSQASLRLVRGSPEFLEQCVGALCRWGAARVLSPPLDVSSQAVWQRAGFEPELPLDVFTRSLTDPVPAPVGVVEPGTPEDWDGAIAVDDAAFSPPWRMGPLGLEEAFDATPRATFFVARADDGLAGFVIVGTALTTAYLQRLAVDPAHRRAGLGRDLVRAACRWGARHGAMRIVLNTQPDNGAAAALYRAEGFAVSPGALTVLGRAC